MYKSVRMPYRLAFGLILMFGCPSLYAQVYSYVDANGVRVFTNVPPGDSVNDLKVSCVPAPSSTATAGTAGALTGKQNDYSEIIARYSSRYGVDPDLVHSMIATESAFNPNAVSPKGAQGLMQLMPATASRYGVRNPFDPEENISGGIRHMRSLLDMFAGYEDSLKLSLAAYNAGENLVQRLGRVPAIPETNEYVRSILQRYGKADASSRSSAPAPVPLPAMYQYPDENGIPVYTNIPPVRTAGSGPTGSPNINIR
jgi:hypothetical protein